MSGIRFCHGYRSFVPWVTFCIINRVSRSFPLHPVGVEGGLAGFFDQLLTCQPSVKREKYFGPGNGRRKRDLCYTYYEESPGLKSITEPLSMKYWWTLCTVVWRTTWLKKMKCMLLCIYVITIVQLLLLYRVILIFDIINKYIYNIILLIVLYI